MKCNKNKKKVIITGITGQDGSYLAEFLLKMGYEVYGFVRRESLENPSENFKNLSLIYKNITLVPTSITDSLSLYKKIFEINPDEFYHLAAHSFVNFEMNDEINVMNVNFNSTVYIVTALKEINPNCKLFFAGSSEMFGDPVITPQTETTRFNPKSIYGISKLSSYYLLDNLRRHEHFFASTGIMYNHESPRRGNQFVTKKIVSTAVKIKYGLENILELGNLSAKRDWGYAPDYVRAMWLILQQEKPGDYIISTGELHTVKEFVTIVFDYLGLDYNKYVVVNEKYFRIPEQNPLCGNAEKLKNIGWRRSKSFEDIIVEMIEEEKKKYGV